MIVTSFYGINRVYVLSFEDNVFRTGRTEYFLPKVEIKDYNDMIDSNKIFDQLVKNDVRTYGSITKIARGQKDDYKTGCLLSYACLKEI